VLTFCEFSVLAGQLNPPNLCLKALDDEQKLFYQLKGICQEQTISKSVNPIIDELLARESHPVHKEKIQMICTAMVPVVYGAEKVSHRQKADNACCV
jgi:hypothetical protein